MGIPVVAWKLTFSMTNGARAVQKNGEEKSLVLNVQRNWWIIVNKLKVKIFFKSILLPRSKLLGSFPSERDLVNS